MEDIPEITTNGNHKALKRMKSNKTLVLDGIIEAIKIGGQKLNQKWCCVTTILLHKTDLDNFGSISLLNHIYSLHKIIISRLKFFFNFFSQENKLDEKN